MIRSPKTIFKAYLFGHYDSRGGAILLRADHFLDAFEMYMRDFGVKSEEDLVADFENGIPDWAVPCIPPLIRPASKDCTPAEAARAYRGSVVDGLFADFIRVAHCVFFDADPPDAGELDAGYAGADGFKYGVLKSRFLGHKPSKRWSEHGGDVKVMVFWRRQKPTSQELEALLDGATHRGWLEYTVEREELGEDACGLYLHD